MAKKKNSPDYLGFSRLVSLILAIIPVTSLIFGFLVRLKEGKIVAALVRILLGWNIVYIIDLVFMILNGRIWRFLDC
jgi:hypothetical protein